MQSFFRSMFKNGHYGCNRRVNQAENSQQKPSRIPPSSTDTLAEFQRALEYPPLPILSAEAWNEFRPLIFKSSNEFLPQRRNAIAYPSETESEDNPHYQRTLWLIAQATRELMSSSVSKKDSPCFQGLEDITDQTVDIRYADPGQEVVRQAEEEWNGSLDLGTPMHGPMSFRVRPGFQYQQPQPRPMTAPSEPFTKPQRSNTDLAIRPHTSDSLNPLISGSNAPPGRALFESNETSGLTKSRTEFSRPCRRHACAYCRRRKKKCSAISSSNWPCDLCLEREEETKRTMKENGDNEMSRLFRARELCFSEETPEYLDFMLSQPGWKGDEGWQGQKYEQQKANEAAKKKAKEDRTRQCREREKEYENTYDEEEADETF